MRARAPPLALRSHSKPRASRGLVQSSDTAGAKEVKETAGTLGPEGRGFLSAAKGRRAGLAHAGSMPVPQAWEARRPR